MRKVVTSEGDGDDGAQTPPCVCTEEQYVALERAVSA